METRIMPVNVPVDVFEAGCRILAKSVRAFFENPTNREGYEKWLQTPEGQRADQPPTQKEQSK